MLTGPEDPAAAGRGRFTARHEDRAHVIDTLKNAFVHGRLTKDEFDARTGQALAAGPGADLTALTADLPGGPSAASAASPAVPARRRPLARATVASVICLIVAAAAVWVAGLADPGGPGANSEAQLAGPAAATQAPVGSRAAALALARQMLSRLVLPAGWRAAHPSPVPPSLNVSSADDAPWYTVDLHRFVLVREPVATVRSFLLAHAPVGMSLAEYGLGSGTSNAVTVLSVTYSPRSLASGLADAELATAAMPLAGGGTLIRADASVSWFPPRSAAEQLNAGSFRAVTVTAASVFPPSQTVTRTFTSPAVIARLSALVDGLPATPYPDVGAMSCLPGGTMYRLDFIPGVVVLAGGCGGSDAVTVNGKQQPRLWDRGVLTAAVRQLLNLTA